MKLKHPYISIEKDNTASFGGSQTWFPSKRIQKCGCGRIAGQDLLLYLGFHHRGCQTDPVKNLRHHKPCIPWKEYKTYSAKVGKWFPVLPYFGMPGWFLPMGINLYCWKYALPYRACWGVLPQQFGSRIEEMIEADLPAVLAVGQNFPFFWGKRKLNFYQLKDGKYVEATKTKAHYVTVTGIDEVWMEISSWGKKYYINREEYKTYVRKYSSWMFSNVCYIYGRR